MTYDIATNVRRWGRSVNTGLWAAPPGAAYTRTSTLPRCPPRKIASISGSRSANATSRLIRSRLGSFQSPASRAHATRRSAIGNSAEATPSRLTPRKMNGKTVSGRSCEAALPQAATAPS